MENSYIYKESELADHNIDILGKAISWKNVQTREYKVQSNDKLKQKKNIKKKKFKEEEGAGTEHPKSRDNQNLSVRSTLKKGKKVELNHYIS